MEELKKKYTPYTESERMSYIREYLSTSETKYQFAKRTGICRRLLIPIYVSANANTHTQPIKPCFNAFMPSFLLALSLCKDRYLSINGSYGIPFFALFFIYKLEIGRYKLFYKPQFKTL